MTLIKIAISKYEDYDYSGIYWKMLKECLNFLIND